MQAITFVLAVAVLHAVAAHVIVSLPNPAYFLTTQSNTLHHRQNRDIEKFDKEYFAECQEEFHVTDFPKRDTDDNPENYKCFLRCLGLKSGVLRDNGDIDEQLMEQKFTKDHPEMLTVRGQ